MAKKKTDVEEKAVTPKKSKKLAEAVCYQNAGIAMKLIPGSAVLMVDGRRTVIDHVGPVQITVEAC